MESVSSINVFSSPFPFSVINQKQVVEYGATIESIVSRVVGGQNSVEAIVFINDHLIPKDIWRNVRPKPHSIVNVRVIPEGGKKGKNPLATVLSIAVMVAAPYAATAILGQGLAATSLLGGLTTVGGVFSGAIGMVGNLLISAIAPPPKPSYSGNSGASNAAESPTQFIEGARNSVLPFGVVPICLGTNRMFPPQCAKPFTEAVGNDQYVRQLFTWGCGDELMLRDIRVGETPITEFNNFQIEHRLNGDLIAGTALYANDVNQDDYNILLQEVDGFTTRTSANDANEIIVDFTFPRGLAQYNDQGNRVAFTVELDLQFKLVGSATWSNGAAAYTGYGARTLTPEPMGYPSPLNEFRDPVNPSLIVSYRADVAVVDIYTGELRLVKSPIMMPTAAGALSPANIATVPENAVRLATVLYKNVRTEGSDATTLSLVQLSDDRQASLFGTTLQTSADFLVTNTGTTLNVAAGSLKASQLRITGAQNEALRKSISIVLPAQGQYDVRVRRLSADTSSDRIFDKAYLTAIRSITYAPPVLVDGINGTAVRIKATDQLNGALDQINAIVSSVVLDYQPDTDTWISALSSNPASLYRYVLQSPVNDKPKTNDEIDLAALEAWHVYCAERGYTYNRIVDYGTSVEAVLRDIAAAGSAAPTILDGRYSVVVDREKNDIVQVVTPRNSWGYAAELVYPDLPHAFKTTFRNKDKGYELDERIVYGDGYSESNATKFEELEYLSCDNANLAFKHARRFLANARLRPELHTFNMDVEHLVATRGDRIKFFHDVPLVGVGYGRIKTVANNGVNVTAFTVDDEIEISSGKTYYVRIRKSNGDQLYKEVTSATLGYVKSFAFTTPFAIADTPAIGDICGFSESGGELDLIITKIEPRNDLSAKITAVDYAPGIFVAESAAIPPFSSNVTTPISLIRPLPPVLVDQPQSGEDVMIKNSDGSFTSRMIVTLRNDNQGVVEPIVSYRLTGTDIYSRANLLESSPERVAIVGLTDGMRYDIQIAYKRAGTVLVSQPLSLNSYLFEGASGTPDNVQNFRSTIAGNVINLSWDANTDIDISHYEIRFSRVFTGATWDTAQVLEERVNETRLTKPFIGGTYLIKAVDLLGNKSDDAAVIITYEGAFANVVEVLQESTSFAGSKTNVILSGGNSIILGTPTADGYYYFANDIDLGEVYESNISAALVANGAYSSNFFDITDIFAESDIMGSGGANLFAVDDIFTLDDVFGIGLNGWFVELQVRTTNDDPSGSPVWTSWQALASGLRTFRAAEFRVLMRSLAQNVTPQITELSVTIDMPDRIERGEDLSVTASGYTVTYSPSFKAAPAVAITLQNAATDDRVEFTSKTASGFTFKVYNATVAGYVTRTFDYISSGYGRVI